MLLSGMLYLLQFLFCAGMYAIRHFTKSKMGMARYMVYFNKRLESFVRLPISLRSLLILLFILLLTAAVYLLRRIGKSYHSREYIPDKVLTAFYIFFGCFWIVLQNTKSYKDYYTLAILLLAAFLVQILRLCKIEWGKNGKEK